ncbi:hypothetical protein R1sor_018923 [Riccia sorocarpa]|uniref:Uncharacterized protein n=1 Tax=Riccia sorocarpa TaxID=122646 RepID=A0ABD3IF71_9MARC
MRALTLPQARLNGTLARDLGGLLYLSSFDLQKNSLTGPIPQEMVSMTALRQLLLQNNQLNGSIPDCAIANLSGPISPLLASSPSFVTVDLSNSSLEGIEPCPLSATPSSPLPDEEEPLPGSAIPPHPVHRRSSNSLSTLTIVALTAGDIALLLMSGAGFVFFISWWKKRSKNNKDDENEDKSANCTLRSVYGKKLGQAAQPHRPTYLDPAPALKPALKSVLGKVNEDDHDTEIAAENDFALSCEEFGMDPVILDRRLVLDIESLLRANADTTLRHNEVGINIKMTNQSKSNQS